MSDKPPERSPPGRTASGLGGEASFDAYYYAHCCGTPYSRNQEWLAFFGGIADRIMADISPGRVLDAGCALGLLVEALRDRGVDAHGIDVSSYAISRVVDSVRPFCRHGSIADPLDAEYDLIVTIETVEHMPSREAERAIENICHHTGDVLFSSSPYDLREPTHINVHGPEHWAEQFARHQFYRDVDFDATFISPWTTRFRRRRDPLHRVIRDYERHHWEMQRARDEARRYAIEVQQHLAGGKAALGDVQRELADARVQLDALGSANQDQAHRLRQAHDTIRHMERSWFWRARSVYTRLREFWNV